MHFVGGNPDPVLAIRTAQQLLSELGSDVIKLVLHVHRHRLSQEVQAEVEVGVLKLLIIALHFFLITVLIGDFLYFALHTCFDYELSPIYLKNLIEAIGDWNRRTQQSHITLMRGRNPTGGGGLSTVLIRL